MVDTVDTVDRVNTAEILSRGGAPRIAFLRYCVLATRVEPLFVFLVQTYRLRPGHAAALALFDGFCARQAPARLGAIALLPPAELRLESAIAPVRAQWSQMQSPLAPDEDAAIAIATPPRHLFDAIVSGLTQDAQGPLARVCAAYDPRLTPEENLPGGKMTAGQRHFVEKVWNPVVKPRLVGAGFWQIADLA